MTPTGDSRVGARHLLVTGALAGLVSAIATVLVAAIAKSAGAGLEAHGEPIPIPAFAFWSIVGGLAGGLLARAAREPRRFVIVASISAAASCIPALAIPDAASTKAILVLSHLIAASIIIPLLLRQLGRTV